MKNKVGKMWVEALRSGEYEQGTQTLEKEGKYCCLGVLCKVAQKEGIHVNTTDGVVDGDSLAAQPHVAEWANIDTAGGINAPIEYIRGFLMGGLNIDSGVLVSHLTQQNDFEKLTFNQIADVIEHFEDDIFYTGEE